MEPTEKTFLYSLRNMSFCLTLKLQKNNLKHCENGVVFRANLLQPQIFLCIIKYKLYFKISTNETETKKKPHF